MSPPPDTKEISDADFATLGAANKAAADKAEKAAAKTASGTAEAKPSEISDEEFAATRPGVLGNTGTDDTLGGVKNIATGVLKGVANIRGLGEGLVGTARGIGAGVQSIWDPRTTKQILEEDEKARLAKEDARIEQYQKVYDNMPPGMEKWSLGKIIEDAKAYRGGVTGENVYKNVFKPVVGEYEAKSQVGKKVQSGLGMAVPMMLGAGSGAGALATGFGTGVAADIANDLSPNNPNPALITSLAAPFAVHGVNVARQRYIPKPDPAKTFSEASKLLADTAVTKDKEALYQKAQGAADAAGKIESEVPAGEHGPGAPQQVLPQGTKTIGELTGDQGLIDLERATRAESKPLQEGTEAGQARTVDQLKQERAEGRVEAGKTTLDPNSSPEAVAQFIEERQRTLDAAADQLGEPMAAGQRGGLLQQKATEYWKWIKDQTSRLYKAIDPDNQYRLLTPGVKDVVKTIAEEEKPGFGGAPTEGVKDFIKRTASWPQVVRFNDLQAYIKDLNLEMRKAAPTATSPGDPGAFRHYKMLRDAAMGDVKNATANQVAREAELVKQGKMKESETLASRLAALDTETGTPAGPTSAVPGEPNLTPQASQALQTAQQARAAQGNVFDNPLVRGIIGAGESDVGGLTAKAFPGKTGGIDKGGEVTRKVLEATNNAPEAIAALQDHAVSLLQSMGEKVPTVDGGMVTRITPKSVQQFLEKYGSSIDALEAAQPGFRARFQNVANVQSELARKFLDERSGAKGGEASRAIVGDLMRDPRNGPAKVQGLIREAGNAPDVVEGLKHLIVENIFNSSLDEAAGQAAKFNGPKFLKLLQTNSALLEAAGFTPQHMKVWQAIARDFTEQQTHENISVKGKLRQDSGTAGNLSAIDRAFAEEKTPFKPSSIRDLSMPAALHQPWAVPFVMAADYGINKLRQFAHNAKLVGIKNRNDLVRAGIIDPELGLRMLHEGAKVVDPGYAIGLMDALAQSSYYGMPAVAGGSKDDKKRPARAAGGPVRAKCDHAACAARLVSQADKIRRGHARHTKVLLNAPDDAVAKALAIAGRGL